MDSGSTASLHSSSAAADEDYDSRSESISSFLIQNPILQPLNTTFFSPSSSSYLQSSNSTDLATGYDTVWSRNIPPEPTFTGFGATQNDVVLNSHHQTMYSNGNQSSPPNANMGRGFDHHHHVGLSMKNPRKRTRASRRAPTTVLTTDTTNFRQMVQEFTGIPTTPFAAAASSYPRRLEHFGGGGGIGSLFPVQPSSSYQLRPSDIQGLQKLPQSLLNSQNHLLSLQSLLQAKLPQQVNANILGTSKSDNQQADLLSGFTSSATRWRGTNDNLVNFDGVNSNTPKLDGYKVNNLDFDNQTDKDRENVISSRNGGDEAQG